MTLGANYHGKPTPQARRNFLAVARRQYLPPPTPRNGQAGVRLVVDTESDGLADAATRVHCTVAADLDSEAVTEYGPEQIGAALAHLTRADVLVGHNLIGHDLPLLQRLHGWAPAPSCKIVDTLVAARLIFADLRRLDMQALAMGDAPMGSLIGKHSLEAWGERLSIPKVGADISDWSRWTPEMQARCIGDVALTKRLFWFLRVDDHPQEAIELEHRAAEVCAEITRAGIPFNVTTAEALRDALAARHAALTEKFAQQFPGVNPNSRAQIGKLLLERGWEPEERTEKTNQPVINDEVLESLPALFPEFAVLGEHAMLTKRLGQLATGDKAWLKHIGPDGRIHGGIIPLGTPHSRAAHRDPNMAQVPNPKKGTKLGTECRSLFEAPPGWKMISCDQATLQDRGVAHYLTPFDDGAYGKAFLSGEDQHWKRAAIFGFVAAGTFRDKANKAHEAAREGAKRLKYAIFYGAGAEKAGHILVETARAVLQRDSGNTIGCKFTGTPEKPEKLKRIGKQALDAFTASIPGMDKLQNTLRARVGQQDWLPGLDGRRVPVSAQYLALNYIVVASEAILCKRWLVDVYDELRARFRYGWDGDVVLVAWVHDELVCCCRAEIAEAVGEVMVHYAKAAGPHYGFTVPLDADYTIGQSWAGDAAPKAPEGPAGADADASRCPVGKADPNASTGTAAPKIVKLKRPILTQADLAKIASPQPASQPTPLPTRPAGNSNRHSSDGSSPHGSKGPQQGTSVRVHVYRDMRLQNYLRVTKCIDAHGARKFHQAHWDGQQWIDGVVGTYAEKKVPYRLPELAIALQADPSLEPQITEGEKDADTAAKLGFVATTNPGGAKQWNDDITAWFRILGVRRAVIHEDNDEAGRRRTAKLIEALGGFVKLRVVRYPELPEGGDLTDWMEVPGRTANELRARIAAAPEAEPEFEMWDAGDDVDKPTPRPWLMGGQFCCTFVSAVVAPGATGKTALRILQGLSLASNRELTGHRIYRRSRVLVVSFEDDREELKRRILAARLHHGISLQEIKGWFSYSCPKGLTLAELAGKGTFRVGPLDRALRQGIERFHPDLVILDPFVRLHSLPENDNSAMNFVINLLTQIAQEYRIAIDAPSHTHKGVILAGDADAGRGASARRDAARLECTQTVMTEEEAVRFGVAPEDRRDYLQLDSAKVNLIRSARTAMWFKLVGVKLDNGTPEYPDGDVVHTLEPWIPSAAWAGIPEETLKAVLDDIEAGFDNGRRRYSDASNAKVRAAWKVVQRHCPDRNEDQCREIIKAWRKDGVLTGRDYYDPEDRKTVEGLHVDPAKRPS
jgi:DNA polymerase I-like protein with 3'-5' exonuclease and polymerase domains